MIEVSEQLAGVLRGDHVVKPLRVDSWRGGELLAENIPVAAGTLTVDASMAVPERVELTVPRIDRGVNYSPVGNDDPLAAYGQLLRVQYGVEIEFGVTEYVPLGWFIIDQSDTDGDTVRVRAVGLLHWISEARFVAPFEPSGNLTDAVRQLVQPALSVEFTGLTNRSVPQGMAFDEDRLGGLFEVLDAWPAEAKVDADGILQVTEPAAEDGDPVFTLSDDRDGTVMRWQGSTGRAGAFNVVVARGEDSEGETVQGVAFDTLLSSPLMAGGPFNPLPVPHNFFSPLLTTANQCRKAAQSILARKRRTQARKVECETVPNPTLETGDVVAVRGDEIGLDGRAVIDAYTLPLTAGQGPMRLSLRVI